MLHCFAAMNFVQDEVFDSFSASFFYDRTLNAEIRYSFFFHADMRHQLAGLQMKRGDPFVHAVYQCGVQYVIVRLLEAM